MDTPQPPPAVDAPAEVSDEEKMLALLAHLSGLVLALIGPLIIFLIKGQESRFVKYHCIQAASWQFGSLVVVFTVLFVTCGLFFPIAFIPAIGSIWVGVLAYGGSWDGYPLLSGIGRPPPEV
ncbi:MAG: DUF4870 domain-containing protein [Deltaproteobacteria bacterium]|nr:DUF4870 domain-containing protein [Deltaproteobacteria bacterium]MBW2255689.1 DUF4870 domain-containing protein [Deltaproteobacteria bacterium]